MERRIGEVEEVVKYLDPNTIKDEPSPLTFNNNTNQNG